MTQQQLDQLRLNSSRQGLTIFGAYAAGAMDASEWQRKHDIEKTCEYFLPLLKRIGCSPDGAQEILRKYKQSMEKEE